MVRTCLKSVENGGDRTGIFKNYKWTLFLNFRDESKPQIVTINQILPHELELKENPNESNFNTQINYPIDVKINPNNHY